MGSLTEGTKRSQTLDTLKELIEKGHREFAEIKAKLEAQAGISVLRPLDSTKRAMIHDSNQDVKSLLEALVTLGKGAEADLKMFQEHQTPPVQYGLTGAPLQDKEKVTHKSEVEADHLFGFKMPALPFDQSAQEVERLLEECLVLFRSVDNHGTFPAHYLEQLWRYQGELIKNLQRHKALCSLSLALPMQNEDELHKNLHTLFKGAFHHWYSDNKERLLPRPWFWDKGPSPCEKIGSTMEVSLRVYGVEAVSVGEAKMFVMLEDGPESLKPLESKFQLKTDNTRGIVLEAREIQVKNFECDRKRGNSEKKLYRLVCCFPAQLAGRTQSYKCLSPPFTVRSGSPQLWQHTSLAVWYIWTQKDVCSPDSLCPRELQADAVLELIQARISGAGLRLKHCPFEPSNCARQRLRLVSDTPLRRLTDGERRGWKMEFKELYDGRGYISRESFQKNLKTGQKTTCLWARVCAAANAGLRLKPYGLDRFFYIGLSNELCISLSSMRHGDLILRSSLNWGDSAAGEEPRAKIIFELGVASKVVTVMGKVEDFEKWTLKEIVEKKSYKKSNNAFVCCILPGREEVCDAQTKEPEIKSEKKPYLNKMGTKELPPETVILDDLGNLSLDTNLAENLEPTSSDQMAVDTDACCVAHKKCALSFGMPESPPESLSTQSSADDQWSACSIPPAGAATPFGSSSPGSATDGGSTSAALQAGGTVSRRESTGSDMLDIMSEEDLNFITSEVPESNNDEIIREVLQWKQCLVEKLPSIVESPP